MLTYSLGKEMMEGVGALIGLLILYTKIYGKVGLYARLAWMPQGNKKYNSDIIQGTSMGLMEISLSYG